MQPFSIHEVGAAAMLPPRDILVSQWADENRVLTGGAAAERGQWRTRHYQREPMDVLSPGHPCRQVVLLSAAQMMKTEVLLNFLGFIADVDPGPVLVVEPRTEDAKALSKDRVAPMFKSTPALRGKIAPVKSRDSNNTTLHKVFVNGAGHITFTGAISPSGLAMRPIRYALLDEVDRYPASAGTEGDPVSLAIQRTAEFQHNKKIVMASTPTVKGVSRIEMAWKESDQRDYFVPCPKCGHYQVLVLGDGTGPGLVWPEDLPDDAMYRCAGCRELIPPHQKAWMVERGEYRAQNPSSQIPGFRISQLISLKRPWGSIATEFVAAKKSPETLKAFMNTVLAELWEENHEVPTDARALWNRCEPFEAEAPDGVALDHGGRRCAGRPPRSRDRRLGPRRGVLVDCAPCDPRRRHAQRGVGSPRRLAPCRASARLRSDAADRGRVHRLRVQGCDGAAVHARPLCAPRVCGEGTRGRVSDLAAQAEPEEPDAILHGRCGCSEDGALRPAEDRGVGPGYCHFPIGRDQEYFDQLTAERKFTRYHNGYPKQEWRKPPAARNEALDCRVYAYAALQALYASGLKLGVHCDRFAKMAGSRRKGAKTIPPTVVAAKSAPRASGTAGKRSAHPCAVRARGAMDTAARLVWRKMTWL